MRLILMVAGMAMVAGCSFEVEYSGTGYACDDGVCPSGFACNGVAMCVPATDGDAAAPADTAPQPPDAPPEPGCGNGVVEADEDCDDGNEDATDACLSCVWARCGDGQVRAPIEGCDDGNTMGGDACGPTCRGCAGGQASSEGTNGHCYVLHLTLSSWPAAATSCFNAGGHLLTVTSSTENTVAANLMIPFGVQGWIGYTDAVVEGQFISVIGDGPTAFGWGPGQPDDQSMEEDCAELRFDGLWNDRVCTSIQPFVCEDEGWTVRDADRHAYKLFRGLRPYSDALARCDAEGGHLVTIGDAAEQAFVAPLVTGDTWIGMDDRAQEGSFRWVIGEPVGYTNFSPGEPNDFQMAEDCVAMIGDGHWNDDACSKLYPFVCEID
jgi:cysteine-rich repeat protein